MARMAVIMPMPVKMPRYILPRLAASLARAEPVEVRRACG
jgi:hypothetical protein